MKEPEKYAIDASDYETDDDVLKDFYDMQNTMVWSFSGEWMPIKNLIETSVAASPRKVTLASLGLRKRWPSVSLMLRQEGGEEKNQKQINRVNPQTSLG